MQTTSSTASYARMEREAVVFRQFILDVPVSEYPEYAWLNPELELEDGWEPFQVTIGDISKSGKGEPPSQRVYVWARR